jgi:hypothetical protein
LWSTGPDPPPSPGDELRSGRFEAGTSTITKIHSLAYTTVETPWR